MKRCVVTPTFIDHFQFIGNFLKSFCQYVDDPESVSIAFIIGVGEESAFDKVISPFRDKVNIIVLNFDNILKNYDIDETSDSLLRRYGKFGFQTMKKLYGMLYLDFDQFLVLDSESSWVNPTNMQELFDSYMANPAIYYHKVDYNHVNDFMKNIALSTKAASGVSNMYFLENYFWIYEKRILNDMVAELGSPFECNQRAEENAKQRGECAVLFENNLYYSYIYKHLDKYGYKAIDVEQYCRENMTPAIFADYISQFDSKFNNSVGFTEHAMMMLNKDNVEALGKIFHDLGIKIIRFDNSYTNYDLQRRCFAIIHPNILASSQEHFFGIFAPDHSIANRINYYKITNKYRIKNALKKIKPLYRLYRAIRK